MSAVSGVANVWAQLYSLLICSNDLCPEHGTSLRCSLLFPGPKLSLYVPRYGKSTDHWRFHRKGGEGMWAKQLMANGSHRFGIHCRSRHNQRVPSLILPHIVPPGRNMTPRSPRSPSLSLHKTLLTLLTFPHHGTHQRSSQIFLFSPLSGLFGLYSS